MNLRQADPRTKALFEFVDEALKKSVSASGNPNGIVSQSPRLRGTSYLGSSSRMEPNPQRGCGIFAGMSRQGVTWRNPVGVGKYLWN